MSFCALILNNICKILVMRTLNLFTLISSIIVKYGGLSLHVEHYLDFGMKYIDNYSLDVRNLRGN